MKPIGTSWKDIANIYPDLHIDRSTVRKIVEKYEESGSFTDEKKPGRPSKVGEEEEKILIANLKKPYGTIAMASKEITGLTGTNVCESTLSNHAHKLGFNFEGKKEAKKEFSPEQLKARVDYCQMLLTYESMRENIIFADESAFPFQRKIKTKE